MFACSFLFFLAAVYFVWKKKNYGLSFICVMVQFAFAFYGYGASHLPYLLYPYLSMYEHFTNQSMAVALIIAFITGLLHRETVVKRLVSAINQIHRWVDIVCSCHLVLTRTLSHKTKKLQFFRPLMR